MPRNSFRYGYVTSLIDRCTCDLTGSAFRILHHICDQTFVVARVHCDTVTAARVEAGMEGVYDDALSLNRSTIRRSLRLLEDFALIQIYGVGGQVRKYVLDIDVLEDRQPAIFGKVKRSRIFGQTFAEAEKSEKLGVHWCPPSNEESGRAPPRTYARIMRVGDARERTGLNTYTTITNVQASLKPKGLSSVSSTPSSFLASKEAPMKMTSGKYAGAVLLIAQNASRSTTVAQDKRIALGKLDALYSRYIVLTREKYGFTPPPMTAMNLAIFKRVFVSVPELDTVELINLVIEHWTAIISGKFYWIKDPPEHPDLLFVCRHLQRFIDATLTLKRGEPLRVVLRRQQQVLKRIEGKDDDKDAKIKSLEHEINYLRTKQTVNGMAMPVLPQRLRSVVPLVLPPEEGQPERDE